MSKFIIFNKYLKMINAGFIFRLAFKIALATYFITHGLDLVKNITDNMNLFNNNASNLLSKIPFNFTVTPMYL
jgi:hypothetical protein